MRRRKRKKKSKFFHRNKNKRQTTYQLQPLWLQPPHPSQNPVRISQKLQKSPDPAPATFRGWVEAEAEQEEPLATEAMLQPPKEPETTSEVEVPPSAGADAAPVEEWREGEEGQILVDNVDACSFSGKAIPTCLFPFVGHGPLVLLIHLSKEMLQPPQTSIVQQTKVQQASRYAIGTNNRCPHS
ncbi:hypothetical protein CVT26_015160 [Gymnopilus dilepis]|uniref:Uncharacterized protein n=1 Tax=Gymnopilus dilepis TaxID=231916 RepID=A0A409WA28_9AGAR|nr:hypothetical protein CVT26_015160 [Gymnopilus dilepis]